MALYLSRTRLLQSLDISVPLTYVYGLSGSGKTALLREWTQTQPRVAWLTASEVDADPFCLWQRLCLALGIKQNMPLTGAVFPSTLEAAVVSLSKDLETQPPTILVIDDYHLIGSTEARSLVRCLLQMRPLSLRLVIASQTRDDSLPLTRWGLTREAIEIGPTDLAFTLDEIRAFLAANQSAYTDAESLYEATQGWVIVAVLLLQQADALSNMERLTSQTLAHRLCAMIFANLSPQYQTFLSQISLLDVVTSDICEAVTGFADSHLLLDELVTRGFLSIDHETHHMFHLSQLWRIFLRSRIVNAAEIHTRASLWYQQSGDLYRAITHALQGDAKLAFQLLGRHGMAFLARGELVTLRGWLNQLPETTIKIDPALSSLMAWVLTHQGLLDLAEAYLHHPDQTPHDVLSIRARIAALRGDKRGMIAFSEQALHQLHDHDFSSRADVLLNLGCAYLEIGQIMQAQPILLEALRLSRTAQHSRAEVFAHYFLGKICMSRGRLLAAQQHYKEGLAAHGDLSVAGVLHVGLAEILYEYNDVSSARSHLERALEMGERGGEIKPIAYAQIALGALVSPDEAAQRLEDLARLTNWSLLYAWQALWWLRAGNISMASYWLGDTLETAVYLSEFERIVQARVLIALEQWPQAERLLNELAESATQHQRYGDLIDILLLKTRAAHAQHQPQALIFLREAMKWGRLGEDDGYLRTFVDEGEPITTLCATLGKSLSFAVTPNLSNERHESKSFALSFGDTLSSRELEILSLVAQGHSNDEIAQTLFLTTGTVKWHVHNIFGKLEVKNRVQAVKKARSLGLYLT